MTIFLAILWIRYMPELKMSWTASDPPAKGYVLMIEDEAGDTECPAAVGKNEATLRLPLGKSIRLIVVPIGLDDQIYLPLRSVPSDWYRYKKWRIAIEVDPVEVNLSWDVDDAGGTVTIFSTRNLTKWKVEGNIPAAGGQWWDNTGEKRKFYKALRR